MIQFCPVCKKILQIKNEDGKNIGFCSCGFRRIGYELSASEKGEDTLVEVGEGVIEKDEFKEENSKLSYEEKRDMKSEI